MQLRRRRNSTVVNLEAALGKGGEGSVFAVRGAPSFAAKIYRKPPNALKVEKLAAMTGMTSTSLLRVAAWPVDLLIDDHDAVRGFLMLRVSARRNIHELYNPKSRRRSFPQADFRFVVRAAANVARAFAQLHSRNHVLGDVNHGNALVGNDGTVVLIDCDSFQIRNGIRTYTCDVGVPLFTAPELQGRAFRGLRRTANHDAFGLAVLLFHLLFLGRHPFAGRHASGDMPIERAIAESRFAYGAAHEALGMSPPPGTLSLQTFGPLIETLFERAFALPLGAPRPAATEWVQALELVERELVPCEIERLHYHPGKTCCWCDIEARTGAITFGNSEREVSPEAEQIEKLWQAIVAVPRPMPTYALAGRFDPPVAKWEEDAKADHMGRIVISWVLVAFGVIGLLVRTGDVTVTLPLWAFAVFIRVQPHLKQWFGKGKKVQQELYLAEQRWEHIQERWKSDCSTAPFERTFAGLEAARDELVALSGIGNTEQHRQLLLARLREGPTELYRKLTNLAAAQARTQKLVDSYWRALVKARYDVFGHQK
jgi:DNA-binding helix-hairpin-helix protein with protein kinase domain